MGWMTVADAAVVLGLDDDAVLWLITRRHLVSWRTARGEHLLDPDSVRDHLIGRQPVTRSAAEKAWADEAVAASGDSARPGARPVRPSTRRPTLQLAPGPATPMLARAFSGSSNRPSPWLSALLSGGPAPDLSPEPGPNRDRGGSGADVGPGRLTLVPAIEGDHPSDPTDDAAADGDDGDPDDPGAVAAGADEPDDAAPIDLLAELDEDGDVDAVERGRVAARVILALEDEIEVLTVAVREAAVVLHRGGSSATEIAATLGVARRAIERLLDEAGVGDEPDHPEAGATSTDDHPASVAQTSEGRAESEVDAPDDDEPDTDDPPAAHLDDGEPTNGLAAKDAIDGGTASTDATGDHPTLSSAPSEVRSDPAVPSNVEPGLSAGEPDGPIAERRAVTGGDGDGRDDVVDVPPHVVRAARAQVLPLPRRDVERITLPVDPTPADLGHPSPADLAIPFAVGADVEVVDPADRSHAEAESEAETEVGDGAATEAETAEVAGRSEEQVDGAAPGSDESDATVEAGEPATESAERTDIGAPASSHASPTDDASDATDARPVGGAAVAPPEGAVAPGCVGWVVPSWIWAWLRSLFRP